MSDDDALHAIILVNDSRSMWPPSRPVRPKQFLDLHAGGRTMLQETVAVLTRLVPLRRTVVVTNDRHVALVREQLPELPPENVLAALGSPHAGQAIAAAAALIRSRHHDALIVSMSPDHHEGGPAEFHSAIRAAAGVAAAVPADQRRVVPVAFAVPGLGSRTDDAIRFEVKSDLSGFTSYPTFPFRTPVIARNLDEARGELVRPGDGGPSDCEFCTATDSEFLWTDGNWRLRLHLPSALPGTVILFTRDHWGSLGEMPVDLLIEFGPLCARIERAILGLGTVARVHLSRSGDGHAHFHTWFYARPWGRQQFRGVFLSTWAEILQPQSDAEVRAAGEAVGRALTEDQPAAKRETSSPPEYGAPGQ